MNRKNCILNKLNGGDCLHSKPKAAAPQVQPEDGERRDYSLKLPDELSFDIPAVYYQRKLPTVEPVVTRQPSAKEVLFFEGTEPVKSLGSDPGYEVIDEYIDKKGKTQVVDHSKWNKVAKTYNSVKGVPLKANLGLAALDAANFYVEHADEIDGVVDFATKYASSVAEGVQEAAPIIYDAIKEGDIPTLTVSGVNLIGVPVVTRTIDNVADAIGIEGVNTTSAVMDASLEAGNVLQEVANATRNENPFVVPTIGSVISGLIKRWF